MAGAESMEVAAFDVVDDEPFFAPVSTDALDGLVARYEQDRARVASVAQFAAGDAVKAVMHYFLEGNQTDDRGRRALSGASQQLFDEAGAVRALNSSYWSKALALTDVLNLMPQKRRDEWHKQIQEQQCPDFTETTVRATLTEMLAMRAQFFGERVDGIFRGLSGEHVTNAPEAFGKRMIIARVLGSYGMSEHSTCGLINDLRCIIARFMGRDEPGYGATSPLINSLKGNWGQWVPVDGGALKIRLYKKGTAHMEVHPDMAWRLNSVLASLYPLAIPAQFRQRPKKKGKEFEMIKRPLPFRVLDVLANMEPARERVGDWPERYRTVRNTLRHRYGADSSSDAMREACNVLTTLGGTKTKEGWWAFEYDPGDVVMEVVNSGCIPDRKAHQFYPTPESVARVCVDMADIGEGEMVLEPSAGQGDLAAWLPQDRTTCVEISGLHCAILKARGFDTTQADFLAWAEGTDKRFDAVVMNPPFSDGRALAHVTAAAGLLKPAGRLVAVVPASMRGKDALPGFNVDWSPVMQGEFAGTSVAVAVLRAVRQHKTAE
jgi:hypothetical protein